MRSRWQYVKSWQKINAETEIAAAMANFDAEIAMILDAELATVWEGENGRE